MTRYRGTIVKALNEELGKIRLTELTASNVQEALAALAARLSTRTVQIAHNVLVRAIRHAERNDLVGRNVAALVDAPKGQQAGRPSNLYQGLTTLARRARDASDQLHPGLSLVAYTLLAQVDATPGMRAADLAAHFSLDKSPVSRKLEQLTSAGLLRRDGERPGCRGYELTLTPAGESSWTSPGTPSAIAWPNG
jgi:DNA-binding MarR family transcriptional regulator